MTAFMFKLVANDDLSLNSLSKSNLFISLRGIDICDIFQTASKVKLNQKQLQQLHLAMCLFVLHSLFPPSQFSPFFISFCQPFFKSFFISLVMTACILLSVCPYVCLSVSLYVCMFVCLILPLQIKMQNISSHAGSSCLSV